MKRFDFIQFFKDRFCELLKYNTLDSYRVRYHNVNTCLKELKQLVVGWQNFTIKRAETLQLCIRETISLIQNDEVLLYPSVSKDSLVKILKELDAKLKSGAENKRASLTFTHIVYLLSNIIDANAKCYLINLFDKIEEMISSDEEVEDGEFVPLVQKLDNLIGSLVRELLSRGFSKRGLFNILSGYKKTANSVEAFKDFRNGLLSNINLKYKVILCVRISEAPANFVLSNFLTELDRSIIPEKYQNNPQIKNLLESYQSKRFYIVECHASDGDSAIKQAKKQLSADLDSLYLYLSKTQIELLRQAIVIRYRPTYTDVIALPTKFFLDCNYTQELSKANQFRKELDKVRTGKYISVELKERLASSLRHLRIGDMDSEIEQRFINYWIGLEYIFSSPKVEDNTFIRLRSNLTTLLAVNYVKRNVRNLELELIKRRVISEDEHITDENIDALIFATDNILLKFRLSKFKSRLFGHKDKRKEYVEAHISNLNNHLSRIYHLRNELIHEAAINQDIEDLTSNLRYYLMTVITRIVAFLSSRKFSKEVSIEEFFYEMEIRNMIIQDSWSLESLLLKYPEDDKVGF